MSSNIYIAFIKHLRNSTEVTSLMANYNGIPSIHDGKLPEDALLMPSMCVNIGSDTILPNTIVEQFFTLSVYAEREILAKGVSRKIALFLDDSTFTVDGITMKCEASGLTRSPSPNEREFNSPISVRIFYYGE